jgi:hypothetical protein
MRASVDDALLQLKYLSFNGWLEMLRVFKGFDPLNQISNPHLICYTCRDFLGGGGGTEVYITHRE